MKLSTVICTRNRANSLARTLQSFREAARDWTMEWELIVVDNGSTDHTAEVISSFAEKVFWPVRLVREERAGVSRSKNLGIRESAGDFIAFTDDDVLITSDWLPAILRTFQRDRSIGVVAGRTLLLDPHQFPHCIRTSPIEAEYHWPAEPDFAVGNNVAVRASALNVVGKFDLLLGPGTRAYGAEDMDMVYRILKAGYVGKYIPEAVLYHDYHFTQAELRQVRWKYSIGNGAFLMKHILQNDVYALKMLYWHISSLLRNSQGEDSLMNPKRRKVILATLLGTAVRILALR